MRKAAGGWLARATNYYRRRSIQFLISLSFSIAAMAGMLFLGFALYLRFAASTEAMVREENKRVIDQVNINLDVYLRNMMRVSDAMYYRVIKSADLADESIHQQMDLLYETNRDLLVSIVVVEADGSLVGAAPVSMLKPTVDPPEQEWFIRAMDRIENLHFSTPHVQNLFIDPGYNYRWVVSLSRAVELTRDGAVTRGVLLVDMNYSGIEQLFKNVNLGGSGYVYLVDSAGEIIYHPRQQLLYSNLLSENNRAAVSYDDGSHVETFDGQERIVTIKTVGYTGWKIVGVTPMQDAVSDSYAIRTFAVFIILFTIFLMIFVNLFISSRIANPIKRLERSVKGLEGGNWDTEIAVGGSYEVAHLGKTIRTMVAQMRSLMDDIVAEQESKRKSEFDALQSQINPHFLYNTLDALYWRATNEGNDEIAEDILSLSQLFRHVLGQGNAQTDIGNEKELLEEYLHIQKMRFSDHLDYEIHMEEAILSHMIPKLILQPFVENAVVHGFERDGGDCLIRVDGKREGEWIVFTVEDNGVGMSEEQLQDIWEVPDAKRYAGQRIGRYAIRNVKERLELLHGDGCTLRIESAVGRGTCVTIRIPWEDNNYREHVEEKRE